MKLSLFTILSIVFTMCVFAQQDTIQNSIKITIPKTVEKSLLIEEIEIPIEGKDTKNKQIVDIKAGYWDTTVYNPYRNTVSEFPFEIKFKDSTYSSPVQHKKVITSRYGWRKGRPHKGIDIDLVTGDSVVSMLDGIVRFARYSRGHGKTVVVRHYNGIETTYAHLSHIAVKANDTISKGQYLGKGGNTGRSRGSHLHLVTSYKGEYIHPEYLFNFDGSNSIRSQNIWVTRKWTRPSYHSSKSLAKLTLFETKEAALASLEKQRKVYVVRKGDTLSRISKRNRTSIAAICRTNKIKKTSTLRIGQKLILEL
ncbi:M23 family metallopeptidase [Winogradskyella luteola]|uniref:Peptidoglycan DD-metalloendopeptidase family protein n=1 Tax=Winogradskyella luteola TaxID=2828330 RepID=A0A9X1F661_9FLAO|nr:M23 family metallopeptidase [Winogradskyella luteola]MBV7268107.1 peptidoglycan DD-metalloendopeptidase family protein [Winogradskyella luteola]